MLRLCRRKHVDTLDGCVLAVGGRWLLAQPPTPVALTDTRALLASLHGHWPLITVHLVRWRRCWTAVPGSSPHGRTTRPGPARAGAGLWVRAEAARADPAGQPCVDRGDHRGSVPPGAGQYREAR